MLLGGGYTGKNQFGLKMDYPALIRGLIRHFQAHQDDCEVHLVPHVMPGHVACDQGEKASNEGGQVIAQEDDYSACEELVQEFPSAVLAPRFTSPSEAKSYISGMDFFMGARMHACIAAFSSGVPVVPMAYSRKFEGLFGSLGYNHTIDCTALDEVTVQEQIAVLYEKRAELTKEAAAATELGLRKLARYEDALVSLFASVAK